MGREEILRRQQQILDGAKAAGRDLTAEEQREFDSLQRELERLDGTAGGSRQSEHSGSRTENGGNGNSGGGESRSGEGTPQTVAAGTPEEVQQAATRAVEEERRRVAEISSLCREFGLEPESYIREGRSMAQVREAVLEELKRTRGPVSVRVAADEGDKFRACAADALMMRAGIPVDSPAAGAGDFRSMRLKDLAVECLAREGEDAMALVRMSPDDMYSHLSRQFYNPTAAFPAILDSTIRKSIVHLYEQVPTTFQLWTTKGSLSDFKETRDHEYVIGGMGDFQEVPENGEIKTDTPKTELLPGRKLKTYAKQFSMTRQAFINDDIGFLTEVPGLYARKARMTVDRQVYTLMYENGKIFDGEKLFSKKHENMMETGAKPSQQSVQKIILRMQIQKDQFGDAIYIRPRYIIVPVGYEFDLAVLLHSTQVTGSANNDINPLYNYPLQVVQTPVLNALAGGKAVPWFMAADPSSAKHIHVDYLNGQEIPVVRRMEAPGVLGFTWDIYTDWGISVRDFRGIAMNPGEVIE